MSQKAIDEYQQFLKDTSWYAHAGERNAKEMAYLVLGLVGEAGEFADEFKKIVREAGFDNEEGCRALIAEGRLHLIDELGDVLWYLVHLCDQLGINIVSLMAHNTHKLHDRLEHNEDWHEDVKWPFSDPFMSKANVGNARLLTNKGAK